MRMMKNNNNEIVTVIGIDHGYGNMKTATRCFPSGVARYNKEPIFQNNLLIYNGMYYQIGEEHKEFCAEKTQDEDYYVLTLAAIARELDGKGMNRATVHIAAGLPLTWVATQKEDFQKYLLQQESDLVIEQVIRTGTADIGEKYLTVIRKAAGDYTKEIFHKLREREYNPELMRLYVVGGGGCMIQNFGEYDKSRVTIVRDICATAKGYEAMTVRKIQRNGGMLV